MKKTELIIADDKARYRQAIRAMLETAPVKIIAEAANGKELLEQLRKKQPDVVLLDLEMPVMDGNETFEAISQGYPEVKVIILSYYADELLIEHYLERGAKGYIPKEVLEPELLLDALRQLSRGQVYLHAPLHKTAGRFTTRQKEIMPLIFEGLTNQEIAEEVYISTRAVEKQRHKIYRQIDAEKAIDLYKYAFVRGLQFLGKSRSLKGK